MRRCTGIAALTALALCSPAGAFADDPAAAEANFQRGLKEMKAGNYDEGCPALAESQRLEPRPGTLFTLAECEARWGKTATATIHYNDYLTRVSQLTGSAKAAHAERIQLAKKRLDELAPKVPQLKLVPPPNAPSDMEVKRDGVVLGAPSLNVALSIDPGKHTITTQVPRGPIYEIAIEVAPGEKKTVDLVVEPAPPADTASAPSSSGAPPAPDSSQPATHPRKIIGLVVGGVGLAGIAVGAVAGILVLGHKSSVDEKCPDGACQGDGLDEVDTMETTAMVSNIGFAAGGALLIGGAVLFLTAPSKPKKETTGWRYRPEVSRRSALFAVGRTW